MIEAEWILSVSDDVLVLRQKIFGVGADVLDESAFHLVAFYNQKPVACLRLLALLDQYRIDFLGVLPDFRGFGVGDLLVRLAIRAAYDMGADELRLSSPKSVLGFFEKLGFIKNKINKENFEMSRKGDISGHCAKL